MRLNAAGKLTWTQEVLGLSQIAVTNKACNWICNANTIAGQLLMSGRDSISLRSLGKHLVVFDRTVVTEDRNRPPPKPRDDPKGSIKVESQSYDIWSITGTDIYQVKGDGNDLVVDSPEYLRLWDMAEIVDFQFFCDLDDGIDTSLYDWWLSDIDFCLGYEEFEEWRDATEDSMTWDLIELWETWHDVNWDGTIKKLSETERLLYDKEKDKLLVQHEKKKAAIGAKAVEIGL